MTVSGPPGVSAVDLSIAHIFALVNPPPFGTMFAVHGAISIVTGSVLSAVVELIFGAELGVPTAVLALNLVVAVILALVV